MGDVVDGRRVGGIWGVVTGLGRWVVWGRGALIHADGRGWVEGRLSGRFQKYTRAFPNDLVSIDGQRASIARNGDKPGHNFPAAAKPGEKGDSLRNAGLAAAGFLRLFPANAERNALTKKDEQ